MQTTTTKKERKIYRSYGLPEGLMIFIERVSEEEGKSVNEIVIQAVDYYKKSLEG